jgi:hypothetical protein
MEMRNDKVLGRFRLGLIAGRYCNLFFFQIFSLKVVRGRQEQRERGGGQGFHIRYRGIRSGEKTSGNARLCWYSFYFH